MSAIIDGLPYAVAIVAAIYFFVATDVGFQIGVALVYLALFLALAGALGSL